MYQKMYFCLFIMRLKNKIESLSFKSMKTIRNNEIVKEYFEAAILRYVTLSEILL